jgi:hypothetical protein
VAALASAAVLQPYFFLQPALAACHVNTSCQRPPPHDGISRSVARCDCAPLASAAAPLLRGQPGRLVPSAVLIALARGDAGQEAGAQLGWVPWGLPSYGTPTGVGVAAVTEYRVGCAG